LRRVSLKNTGEPAEPSWRPFDRDRDGDRDQLFDRDFGGRNALIWAGAGELATLALIFVAVILLGFILIKRSVWKFEVRMVKFEKPCADVMTCRSRNLPLADS
jgi:hypothetical protein